jgi:mannose-6-phosphate isomerase-like protein (cupin superfamily)
MAQVTAKARSKRHARPVTSKKRAAHGTRRRTARTKSRAKARAKPVQAAKRPQRFVVSHLRENDFLEGLRAYAKYRDLGIADATHGMVRAHVIRFTEPFEPGEVSKLHYHDVDFQMVYVLKGWMRTEFEGQGAITMHEGSCWIQPPRIKHTVLGYSDNCEVLEIILPADFETVALE